jgi:hypothetical protein
MEHSFAASPRMLFPLASTFTWKLVNAPNCEIIRGEVSIVRGSAGGLSYVSSGTFLGALCVGANWAEAPASVISEIRQVKTVIFTILERIII